MTSTLEYYLSTLLTPYDPPPEYPERMHYHFMRGGIMQSAAKWLLMGRGVIGPDPLTYRSIAYGGPEVLSYHFYGIESLKCVSVCGRFQVDIEGNFFYWVADRRIRGEAFKGEAQYRRAAASFLTLHRDLIFEPLHETQPPA